MYYRFLVGIFAALLSAESRASGPAFPPNFTTEFVMRQVENGQVMDGLHYVYFNCRQADCAWRMVTLNQCIGGKFFPQQEIFLSEWTYHFQEMVVKRSGQVFDITLKLAMPPEAEIKLAFSLECLNWGKDPTRPQYCLAKPRSFKGNMTRYSMVLKKVLSVNYELVPASINAVELKCKALVD